MSLRHRLAVTTAACVSLAVALAAAMTYVALRHQLMRDVRDALRTQLGPVTIYKPGTASRQELEALLGGLPTPSASSRGYVREVDARGRATPVPGVTDELAVSKGARDVAAGKLGSFGETGRLAGIHVYVYTRPLGPGLAVQGARSLTGVDQTLAFVRRVLAVVLLGITAVAAILGVVVARSILRPIGRLGETSEAITNTLELSRRVDETGDDELARLAGSFNRMLAALEDSLARQHQLMADASHELRTPIASLRTSLEVLLAIDSLSDEERSRLLTSLVVQVAELGQLVDDIVETVRVGEVELVLEEVRLGELAETVVRRTQALNPAMTLRLSSDETLVLADRERIDQAIANVLDNAIKWSPAGAPIDVVVSEGAVTVYDRGPGIRPEDRTRVFERFYRAPEARGTPGSGLGLAMVRTIAEAHGGEATVLCQGGGARVRLRLATLAPE